MRRRDWPWARRQPKRTEAATGGTDAVDGLAPGAGERRRTPAVVTRNLGRSVGRREAVRGISLVVEDGETLGLLGRLGAGKTTTIGLISTRLRPTRGEVRIFGNLVSEDVNAARRLLNVASEEEGGYPSLTGEENVDFFARLYGVPRGECSQRVAGVLELVEMTPSKDDRLASYSRGMRRRLSLACALVTAPRLLPLDEPTVGVDLAITGDPPARREAGRRACRSRRRRPSVAPGGEPDADGARADQVRAGDPRLFADVRPPRGRPRDRDEHVRRACLGHGAAATHRSGKLHVDARREAPVTAPRRKRAAPPAPPLLSARPRRLPRPLAARGPVARPGGGLPDRRTRHADGRPRRQSRADARHRTRMRVHLRVPGWALVADLGGVPVGATAVDDRVHELGDAGNERPHAARWRPRGAAGHGRAVVREWHSVSPCSGSRCSTHDTRRAESPARGTAMGGRERRWRTWQQTT